MIFCQKKLISMCFCSFLNLQLTSFLAVYWSLIFLSNLFALRLSEFKAALLKAFSSAHAQTLPLTTVKESVKRDKAFRDEEIESALQVMQDANQIMVADDSVFLIWKHLWVTSNERCTKAVVNCVCFIKLSLTLLTSEGHSAVSS